MLNFNLFARRTKKNKKYSKNNKKIHEPVLFLYSVDKCPLCFSAYDFIRAHLMRMLVLTVLLFRRF